MNDRELENKIIAKEERRSYSRFVIGFLSMILFVVGGYTVWRWYEVHEREKMVNEFTSRLGHVGEEIRAVELSDAYGGTTPQETLRLYVDAIQKNDYELAIRYFISGDQETEFNALDSATKEDLAHYLVLLRDLETAPGTYAPDKKLYSIPMSGNISADFVLYPNGVWKMKRG